MKDVKKTKKIVMKLSIVLCGLFLTITGETCREVVEIAM